jgi:hypothetical protein
VLMNDSSTTEPLGTGSMRCTTMLPSRVVL